MQRLEREFHFFVPVDVAKSAALNDDGDWVFEGIASTSNMDLFGDVVYPASFQKSLEFFKQNGKIFYNHNYAKKMASELMEAQTPIGVPIDAELTDEGLYIKAVLNKQHPLAQKIWKESLSNPDPRFNNIGLSIGAKALGPTERKYSDVHKRYVSVLPDLLLYEVSMTATPVNPETKTWVSKNSFAQVMKSIVEDDEPKTQNVETMQVIPDEVIHDAKNNLLVVKSSVQAEDGTTYVFEQTIDMEDVKKAMPETDDKKKPQEAAQGAPDAQEKPDAGAPDTNATPDGAAPDAGAEGQGAPDGEAGGNPFGGDDAAEGMPGADPAGQDATAPGATPEGSEAGGTPLDGLFGGDGAAGGAPGEVGPDGQPVPGQEAPQEDASMALLLDKVDTLVEVMTTIAQDLAADKQSQNPGVDVQDTPPAPANDDILKAVEALQVDLSKFSGDNLSTIIKSVITDVITEVVRKELTELVSAGGILKSASTVVEPTKTIVIRQPAVEVAAIVHETGDSTILKAFDGNEIDATVLKSYIANYIDIKGGSASHSSKRANVLHNVEEKLGIPQHEFLFYVRKHEKGTLN